MLLALPRLAFAERWAHDLPSLGMIGNQGAVVPMGERIVVQEPSGLNGGRLGALDARTGRLLWRNEADAERVERIAVGSGHLVALRDTELVELDPASGRVVWRVPVERYHLGPYLAGHTVVAETKAGLLRAFDLRTHRPLWSLQREGEFRGYDQNGAAALVGGALWAKVGDHRVLKVSMTDGRVLVDRSFDGGTLGSVVPMGARVALIGDKATVAVRSADGTELWRKPSGELVSSLYASARDELWSLDWRLGSLLRVRASDGTRVGEAVNLAGVADRFGGTVAWGKGYLVPTSQGLMRLDASGSPTGEYASGEYMSGAIPLGSDLLAWSFDRVVRLRPDSPVAPKGPGAEARRLVAKGNLTVGERAALERLGRAAVPAIVAALARPEVQDRQRLEFVLFRVAEVGDTTLIFPLADRAKTFAAESTFENRDYRLFMERNADPEVLVPLLLPRLRAAKDDGTRHRLVEYLGRSKSPQVATELRRLLLAPETSLWTKDEIYHGLAGSLLPESLALVRALRVEGPSPQWKGETPSPPRTEEERVLAATFDARMRFYRPRVETFDVDFGPEARSFAVEGWPGGLRASAKAEMPYVRFEPLDGDGTRVRFSKDGREATARIGVMIAPLYGLGYEASLRKVGEEWFVLAMRETWIS